jgi:hypothetical protein
MGYFQGYFQSLGVGGVGAPPFNFQSLGVGGVGAPPFSLQSLGVGGVGAPPFSFQSLGVGGVGAPPFAINTAPLSFDVTADFKLIAPTRINIDAAITASCLDIVPPRYGATAEVQYLRRNQ